MSRDPRLYIHEMLDATIRASRYGQSLGPDGLKADSLRADAIIRCLIVLGEACKLVSSEHRTMSPDLAWKEIAKMRDLLTHGYFRVDLELVADVVANDLPILETQLRALWQQVTGSNWQAD